jgi:hypothetical protein
MSSTPDLDLHWIDEQLAIGGRIEGRWFEHLGHTLGISRVVDVRQEACDDAALLRQHGIELLHLPTEDRCGLSLAMLEQGVEVVGDWLAERRRVFIHCEHGMGRSALLACCVLVSRGREPLEALRCAKAARPKVSPSPEQLARYIAWTEGFRVRARAPWQPPDLEALMQVACALPAQGSFLPS